MKTANTILMGYDRGRLQPKERKTFFENLEDYVRIHGKIRIREDLLDKKACYPDYNKVAEFYESKGDIFSTKKK